MPKVLIVDDQAKVARAISLLLELHHVDGDPELTEPIEAVLAAEPEEALSVIDRGGIDLVIQDMNFSPGKT
ncbi:MAG: hypothetical protein MPN21_12455, partial [Thermoanaerobaculia bacterium]|nr:hypothetical protein [Thermoanaerobaculia bacterium]